MGDPLGERGVLNGQPLRDLVQPTLLAVRQCHGDSPDPGGGPGGSVRPPGNARSTNATADPERAGVSRALAVLVACAFFMDNLDATISAPAAPAMAADLGVQPVQINVAITA